MFRFVGRFVVTHPRLVCAAWIVLAVGITIVAPDWRKQTQDDDIRFLPSSYPVVRGYDLMGKAFPQDVFACRVIFAVERPESELTDADFALVDSLASELQALAREDSSLQISSVVSYRDPTLGSRLVSADKHCTLLQVSLATPYLAVQTRVTVDRAEARLRPLIERLGTNAPQIHVTGPGGIGRDLVRATAESLDNTAIATVVLVIVMLLIIYRSPLLALIPLVTIGVASWVALQALALVTLIPGVQLVNISQIFSIVILFGAGTDYCLFLISRYREELEAGETRRPALTRSIATVGGALAASAGTVMVGLAMMGFSEFGKIRCAGPVIALALAIGLAASLTLTPALLKLAGKAAFWPRRIRPITPARAGGGVWDSISKVVVRRPLTIWFASLALLVPLGLLGLQVSPTFKPIGDLSRSSQSMRGLAVVQNRFPAGEVGPITVLLASTKDWNTDEGREEINSLSRGLGFLDGVAEVRSLTQPLGKPLPDLNYLFGASPRTAIGNAARGLRKDLNILFSKSLQKALEHYVNKIDGDNGPEYVTRLDLVFKSDPFDHESVATLAAVEAFLRSDMPTAGVRAECYGVTVHTRDMSVLIEKDRSRVNMLVLGGVFLILLVLVRKLWLALYLLATVLLSYFATLGVTALFAMWWSGQPFGQIEWRVPFFLFTILVAVGEDYNILMVSRALQERKRWGVIEGLRRGLARTGGTVTACGLIMAGTFSTLMLADLWTLKQIGFALAVGVLLDTLLVRPFLVPSLMLVVWRDYEQPRQFTMTQPVSPFDDQPIRVSGATTSS
jgi:putative drug exporter of the RND superfamily